MLDYVLAIALIAAPFVLGFSDETAPTAFFIVIGVVHLLVTIGTRFVRDELPRRGRGGSEAVREGGESGDAMSPSQRR